MKDRTLSPVQATRTQEKAPCALTEGRIVTDWTRQVSSLYKARQAEAEIARGEVEDPHAPVSDGYWLRHCHGFRVDSPRGRVGIVEDVLYGAAHDRPSALALRGGLFGQRLELVPIEEVDTIDPRRKRVALRPSAGANQSGVRVRRRAEGERARAPS